MSSRCLKCHERNCLPFLVASRECLIAGNFLLLLICPNMYLFVPSNGNNVSHLLVFSLGLESTADTSDLGTYLCACVTFEELCQALSVTEVPHAGCPITTGGDKTSLCLVKTAGRYFGFLKIFKVKMITPWASPNLDINLPVSISQTEIKLPSSPDTTASNSVLYKAKDTGYSWLVFISSWVLKNQRLTFLEQARILFVVLSKRIEVRRSSGR